MKHTHARSTRSKYRYARRQIGALTTCVRLEKYLRNIESIGLVHIFFDKAIRALQSRYRFQKWQQKGRSTRPILPFFRFPEFGNRDSQLQIERNAREHCTSCYPHTPGALWSQSSTCLARYRDLYFTKTGKRGGNDKYCIIRPS